MHVGQHAHVLRTVRAEEGRTVLCEERADRSAQHRNHTGLGECLTQDPSSSRTQRDPSGELVRPTRHSGQEQIRDARARCQMQQRGGREDQYQPQPNLSRVDFAHGYELDDRLGFDARQLRTDHLI